MFPLKHSYSLSLEKLNNQKTTSKSCNKICCCDLFILLIFFLFLVLFQVLGCCCLLFFFVVAGNYKCNKLFLSLVLLDEQHNFVLFGKREFNRNNNSKNCYFILEN